MELYGKTLCVSYDELVGSALLTRSRYQRMDRDGLLTVVQRGGRGRKALVVYDSLPADVRRAYDEAFPAETARFRAGTNLLHTMTTPDTLRSDPRAAEYFRLHEPRISLERQEEYVLNARVLNALIRHEQALTTLHAEHGYRRTAEVRRSVVALSEELRTRTGHTLPASASRLSEKLRRYRAEGYASLVCASTGNQSARKINEAEGRLLLRLKRSKFPVYTDRQLFDAYNEQAARSADMQPIRSLQTVTNYLYGPAVKLWWYGAVYGEIAFKNAYMPTLDTKLPAMPFALWYGDGTKLNLYYRAYDEGQRRWTMRTIDVYEVMDACTEMFIGYAFGPENFRTQYAAYRMALEAYKIRPFEIVTDNQGGHRRPEAVRFFDGICRLHKTTMPHNGQSKTIESAFGRFQQQVLHRLYNYTGQNITARKASSHANVELTVKNIQQLPTLEEVKAQYLRCRDEWNALVPPKSATGLTRAEMQQSLVHPRAERMDDYELSEAVMLLSASSVRYAKQGYVFERDGQEHRYMVYGPDGLPDMDWHMRHIGVPFRYRFDPQDMGRIELWEEEAGGALKYAATATPKQAVSRATADRSEGETAALLRGIRAGKEALARHYLACEELAAELQADAYADEGTMLSGEAGTRLVMPRPVGWSEKELRSLVKNEELRMKNEETLMDGVTSPGEYTKAVSSLTDAELYEGFL